jgi:TfoX/Sxy family transcriptional regulator of competence genes
MTDAVSRSAALSRFGGIVDALGHEVERKQMMGSPILMREGKMVACLDGDLLAVKLGRDRPEHAEALAVPGADTWSPQESRRAFTDWVGIPMAACDVWLDWVRTAIGLADEAALTAASRPAKPRKPAKPGGGGGGGGI